MNYSSFSLTLQPVFTSANHTYISLEKQGFFSYPAFDVISDPKCKIYMKQITI